MEILLAILLGGAFGFVLQRIGATNPDNIINMLALRDFRLMKTILTAIGASTIGIYAVYTLNPEWVHLSPKSAELLGVGLGGLIFGTGFALAGYCPGTSVCALGEGRRDALLFVAGGLVGALGYMLLYGRLAPVLLADSLDLGKITLTADVMPLPALITAALVGGVFLAVAMLLPAMKARQTTPTAPRAPTDEQVKSA